VKELDPRTVVVGQQLDPFVRTTSFENWNRFAAVNDEFVAVHMDDAAGRAAGNPSGAFGMGTLRLSYLMNLLRAFCGETGRVRSIEVRYRDLNRKDDVLTAVGTVAAVRRDEGEIQVTVDVDVRNQDGMSTAPGRATVAFPMPAPDGG
jgi:acyl dehydratase